VWRWVLLALVLAACGGSAAAPAPELRKVDAYPLYELTDTAPTPTLEASVGTSGWACTVFFGAGGEPIVGRNFDFHDEPALVLHHRPPGAYRSVSVVDISYLGFDRRHLDGISAAGLKDASRLPFDGMNERGVAVAMAAVPSAKPGPGRLVGSLGVMGLVLDRAASVGAAFELFRAAAPDFSGGPPLHYLVADASGASAVVEYVRGRVRVIERGARPWQAMTNFVLTGARGADHRYRTAARALGAARGRLTPASAIALLQRVRQPITRWSAAYDLRARTLHIVMGQKYGGRTLTFGV
jgi:choloylglycine hydrolase